MKRFFRLAFTIGYVVVSVAATTRANSQIVEATSVPSDLSIPSGWITLPAKEGQVEPVVRVSRAFPTDKATPVVIMLHGACGIEPYQLNALEQWSEWFAKRAIASLIVDSYRSRSMDGPSTCRKAVPAGWTDQRAADVLQVFAWLGKAPWADSSRVMLFGESQGARVALNALSSGLRLPVVALYGCSNDWFDMNATFDNFPPSLFLVGELDTLQPAKRCRDSLAKFEAVSPVSAAQIKLLSLKGAHHAFDVPNVSGTFNGETLEYNAAAVQASKELIDEFLRRLGWIAP